MNIKEITIKELLDFRFDRKGFIITYIDEHEVQKQYGSTSRSEMSQFAEILAGELRPIEGVVG